MFIQEETREPTSNEWLQKKYIGKLIESLNLEIEIEYATTEQCAYRLEMELEKPYYSESVRRYIQSSLDGMVDDTEDNRIDAYLRQQERYMELCERGVTDFANYRPEDDPEYPRLEQLWKELEILENQLEIVEDQFEYTWTD